MNYIVYIGVILLPIVLILVFPVSAFYILRSWSQTLKWEAGLLIASSVALLGYYRLEGILSPLLPIPAYVNWALKILAILSPACIAVAWLRWNGFKWWQSLLLFPLVPVGMIAIRAVIEFPFGG